MLNRTQIVQEHILSRGIFVLGYRYYRHYPFLSILLLYQYARLLSLRVLVRLQLYLKRHYNHLT